MNKLKYIALISLIALSIEAYSQKYVFKVLATYGSIKVSDGAGNFEPIKTGKSLFEGDVIQMGEKTYLGLVHKNGQSLEWRKEGTIKVLDLEGMISGKSNIVSKYADYLSGKMHNELRNKSVTTGGVNRSGDNAGIHIYSLRTTKVNSDSTQISWESVSDSSTYMVVLKNLYDDVLWEEQVRDTTFTIDFSANMFTAGESYKFQVSEMESDVLQTDEIALTKLSGTEIAKISRDLENYMEGVNDYNALGNYLLTAFYEKNGLILNAISCYEKAINLAPEVVEYQNNYRDFLDRYELNKNK